MIHIVSAKQSFGRLFHNLGPLTLKDLLANVLYFTYGIINVQSLSESQVATHACSLVVFQKIFKIRSFLTCRSKVPG